MMKISGGRTGVAAQRGKRTMINWWQGFGRESVIAGLILGIVVALIPILHRWWAARRGHPSPERHGLLFVLDVLHMGSLFALGYILNAMVELQILPRGLMWMLLGLALASTIAGTLLGQFAKDRVINEKAPSTPIAGNKVNNGSA
jgi:hypothetical protein